MTKLKTLKDLDFGNRVETDVKILLKTEAIKWVKEDINEEIEVFKRINCPMTMHEILTGNDDVKDNRILKWMERFNLTEEDLK